MLIELKAVAFYALKLKAYLARFGLINSHDSSPVIYVLGEADRFICNWRFEWRWNRVKSIRTNKLNNSRTEPQSNSSLNRHRIVQEIRVR